jgi:hypothetical protein
VVHKYAEVFIEGRDQVISFPLTLTLSPIGGEGIKKETT